MYTRKQKEIINRAWSELVYHASVTGSAEYKLDRALKMDAKDRGSIHITKRLILQKLSWAVTNNRAPLSAFVGISPGIVLGVLAGLEALESSQLEKPGELPKLWTLIHAAIMFDADESDPLTYEALAEQADEASQLVK